MAFHYISYLFFFTLFFKVHALMQWFDPNPLFCSNVAAALHVLIQVPSALYSLWTSRTSEYLITVSAAFFTYDVFVCLIFFQEMGMSYLAHAVAACTAFNYFQFDDVFIPWVPKLLVWEISNVCVHSRWFMNYTNQRIQPWYNINNIALVCTFFFNRVVWTMYMYHEAFLQFLRFDQYGYMPLLMLLGPGTILTWLNIYWFRKMLLKIKVMVCQSE